MITEIKEAIDFYRKLPLATNKENQSGNMLPSEVIQHNRKSEILNLHRPIESNFIKEDGNIWSKMMSKIIGKNSFEVTELIIDDLLQECVLILNKIENQTVSKNKEKEIEILLKNIKSEQFKIAKMIDFEDEDFAKKDVSISGNVREFKDLRSTGNNHNNQNNPNHNFSPNNTEILESQISVNEIVPSLIYDSKRFNFDGKSVKNIAMKGFHDFRNREAKPVILDGEFLMRIFENQMLFEDYSQSKNFLNRDYVFANELALEQILSDLQEEVLAEFSRETEQISKEIVQKEIFV